MSHQSGIVGSAELNDTLSSFLVDDAQRLLKVSIEDEKLVAAGSVATSGDWEADYEGAITSMIDEDSPCYLIYRLDSTNHAGSDFVFIAWSPDFAHIRQKMLYASTRATLKSMIGLQYIKEEIFGTVTADVNLEGYKKHLTSEAAPPPLTNDEIEKAEIRAIETGVEIGASTKRSMATGIAFPMTSEAADAVKKLQDGKITYVALSVDIEREEVALEVAENLECDGIRATIPADHARYHVFNFKHNHEGDSLESIVFVYSCPGYSIPVKERMLFSSAKGPLVDELEGSGFDFAKKLEIGEADEFTTEWLYDQLHPAKTVFKQKFARPARPGKGGRRLMRSSRGGSKDSVTE